jgi:hypothetical protein
LVFVITKNLVAIFLPGAISEARREYSNNCSSAVDIGLLLTGQDRLEMVLNGGMNPGAEHERTGYRLLGQAAARGGRLVGLQCVDEHAGLPNTQFVRSSQAEAFREQAHEVDLPASGDGPNGFELSWTACSHDW